MLRRIAMGAVGALFVASCGQSTTPIVSSTTGVTTTITAPAGAAPPAYVARDVDASGAEILTVGFVENPDGVTSATFITEPGAEVPSRILITFEGEDAPGVFTFDNRGRPRQIIAPDGAEIRVLGYEGDVASVLVIDAGGRTETMEVTLPTVDTGFLDAPAAAGVRGVPAAYRAPVTPPATITSTIEGRWSVMVVGGLSPSDVVLRPRSCSVAWIGDVASPVSCSTLIGVDGITVRTVVDVAALYGGDLPTTWWETQEECEAGRRFTGGIGALLLAGALATLVLTGVGAVVVGTVGGMVTILGIGSVSAFVTTVAGGGLIAIADRTCRDVLSTNEGLRADAVSKVAESVIVSARYAPAVLRDQDRWTAKASPRRLDFSPFGADAPRRLDTVIVTVEEADATDVSFDGRYTGSVTRYPEQDLVGVSESTVTAVVDGGTISGTERFVAVRSPDYGQFVEVEVEGTQWVEFEGDFDDDGTFRVPGLSFSSFRILSCEGSTSNCNNVYPPESNPDGYGVDVVGRVVNGVMTAEIIWPGNAQGTYAFEATKG